MARTPKNPNVERVARIPFDKDSVSPMPQITPRAAAGAARRELHMGMPGPTRTRRRATATRCRPTRSAPAAVSESSTANAQDLPDVTAPPPARRRATTSSDLPRTIPARRRRRRAASIRRIEDELRRYAVRRLDSASTGRVVTERETVADDEADADGTDRNAARRTTRIAPEPAGLRNCK